MTSFLIVYLILCILSFIKIKRDIKECWEDTPYEDKEWLMEKENHELRWFIFYTIMFIVSPIILLKTMF